MEINYTPLDTNKIEKKDSILNTILLSIVTFTALVLVVMLFILIQKKIRQTETPLPATTPSPVFNTPTPYPTEIIPTEIIPTEIISQPDDSTSSPTITDEISPEASPTSEITE